MEKTVKVGVVGTGAIGRSAHIPGYLSCPSAELVALVDTNADNLARANRDVQQATGHSVATFSTLEALIASHLVDAVSIAVPNAWHVPLAEAALNAGLHVLVEKPMALTNASALQLKRAADRQDVIAMVGQTHRYRQDVTALKRFIDRGTLGAIYHAEARILRRRGTPTGWFTNLSVSGGGPLMDIGVHALDLAWWLMGRPQPSLVLGHVVCAIGNDEPDFVDRWTAEMPGNEDNRIYDTEDFATALVRFHNGATLQLTSSWNINGAEDDRILVNLYGSKAGISLEPPALYSIDEHVLTTTRLPIAMGDPHTIEMHHFIESIRTHQVPKSPVADAVTVTAMLVAIADSSRQATAVSVEANSTR